MIIRDSRKISQECLRLLMEHPHPERLTDENRENIAKWLFTDMRSSARRFLDGCLDDDLREDIRGRLNRLREERIEAERVAA